MNKEVCAAHDLLIDNMTYIRGKQDETSSTVQELKSTVMQMNETQEQMMRMMKKRKWTTAKISILAASVFGSGSAFPAIVSMIISKVSK